MTIASPLFEIAPHPLRGTNEAGSERIVLLPSQFREAEGSSAERPILEITSTSTAEDRHGSRIFLWKTATHMRDGKVLWQHDACPWLPQVAKKLSERQEGDRTISTHELLINLWRHIEQAYGNLPAFLFEAAKLHEMGAISRAFIPLKMKSRQAETIPTQLAENIDYLEVEQTEESYVNVQSNRESLYARTIARARTAGHFTDGLARTLGYDVTPYVIDTRGSAMKKTEAFRARIADVLKRCGCDSYREPEPEVITDEEKAVDIASITTLVTAQLAVLDSAIAAWKATASMKARGTLSSIAISAMYSIEWLIYRADEWYDAEIDITFPDISMADMEAVAGAADITLAAPAGATRAAKPTRARVAALRSFVKSAHASLRGYWTDYTECGTVIIETCDICWTPVAVGCDCTESVDDATAAVEQQSIANVMDIESQRLVAALAGWDGSKHDALRDFFAGLVNDCIWRVDRLLDMQEYWYADAAPGLVATVDPGQMRKFVAAIRAKGAPVSIDASRAELDTALAAVKRDASEANLSRLAAAQKQHRTAVYTRIGAELSKKNKNAITDLHGHATEMVRLCETMITDLGDATDAGNTDDQPGEARSIRVVSGSSSSGREDAAGQTIRVISATDVAGAGPADRSTHQDQPDLYDGTTLRVKRS